MRYAGLTDEPAKIKRELDPSTPSTLLRTGTLRAGKARDFKVMQQFTSEAAARQWERRMLGQGYQQDTTGKGWKYGYTFST